MSIFVSILISALAVYNILVTPAPFDIAREASLNPDSSTNQLRRTLFGVTCSCLSTTVLFAWTAAHPNVPRRNKWYAQWNRLKLMVWMIVAPDLVLAWAVRQYFAAKDARDAYNERKGVKEWTISHGHLLSMGGYTMVNDLDGNRELREPRKPGLFCTAKDWEKYYEVERHYQQSQLGTLTVDEFKKLIDDVDFEFPDITEAEIADRSKVEGLFKLIAILQTTWFIIQCIARRHQRLAVTELELVTLALACLNGVTFAIWWHKPLGVQEPIKIYLKSEEQRNERANRQENRKFNLSFGNDVSMSWKVISGLPSNVLGILLNPCKYGPMYALYKLFIAVPFAVTCIVVSLLPLGVVLLLRHIETEPVPQQILQSRRPLAARIVSSLQRFHYFLSSGITAFVKGWLDKICSTPYVFFFIVGWFILLPLLFFLLSLFIVILLTPLLALLFLVSFIFTAVFGIVTTNTIHPGASHIPTFYASKTNSDRWSRMVVFALFGITFGGVHCIGWNFQFPTPSEQMLWRATSLAITVIPLIVAPIDFLLATQDIDSCQVGPKRTILLILDLIMTILLFIYVPARLSLIGQALSLLRAQPADALVAVDWTKYVPHLLFS